MKILKRTLSLFLALLTVMSVMVVGVGSFTASAKSEKLLSNGFFTYYHSGDNYVGLVRAVDRDYTGKTFVIPYKIDGREVICANDLLLSDLRKSGNADTITSIKIEEGITQLMTYYTVYREMADSERRGALSGLKNLKEISFPSTLSYIDDGMFRDCVSLKKAILPDALDYMGDAVFRGCTSLEYVKFPSEMREVPDYTFEKCKSLKSISLGKEIMNIGDSAFAYCESLEGEFKLPKWLFEIGPKAFYGCKSLTGKIKLSKHIRAVYDGAFAFCTGLTGFTVSDRNENYSQKGGVLFNKNKTKIHCYLSGKKTKEYKIPSTVADVADYAFAGTKNLKKITLSKNMMSTGDYAFYKSKVKEVVLPSSIRDIGEGSFKNCKNITSIKLPSKLIGIGNNAFENCKKLKEIKIPSKVETVGAYAFKGCSSLKSLTFPKSVETIVFGAFDNCKNLKSVKILNSKCDVYAWGKKVSGSKPTIYGYKNSTAQKFAKKAKLKFAKIK